jgi:hypothetical protein
MTISTISATTSVTALTALLMIMLPAPASPGPLGSLRSIDRGLDSQIDDARQVAVRSAMEWEKLWRLHGGARARPAVDFRKDMVVAVFLGSRPTAGYSVEIVDTRPDGASLIVQYRETRPAPGGIAAQVLTSPYHIVALPRQADVKFEKVN